MSAAPFPKFHTSLNVSDLGRSIDFYRVLFGLEPAKRRPDYAKFEVPVPPLVLSLIPGHVTKGGTLNHVGVSLPGSEDLVKIQARLEAAGIKTQREEGVECCYSRQTKFWVTDPDQTLWELYVFHEDIDDHGHDHAPKQEDVAASFAKEVPKERITWGHNIAEPIPEKIPHADFSVHEVFLQGSANQSSDSARLAALLAEANRVLRPGGEVRIRGIGGSKPYEGAPLELPGPAARVKHVPGEAELVRALLQAGFVDIRFEKLSQKAYFEVEGVQMREVLIAGRKPGHRPRTQTHQAIYLGPLAQVADDYGNSFPRGERVNINIHDWQALSQGSAAPSFQLLSPEEAAQLGCCDKQ
jgi:catechol 2,3-dioxygenase-like lactoylglutathione lyase family enzyme